MARLSIRIYLDAPERALGPGMMQLLEGVAEHGSIRKSAAAMKMSYRKSWLLIQNMQDTFGGAVVTTSIGGSKGGGAELTELGKSLLTCYRRIESRSSRAAAKDVAILLSMSKRCSGELPKRKNPKS
jgi:molybdate transport system regulatory protein